MSKRKYMIIILVIILGVIALILMLPQLFTPTPKTFIIGENIGYSEDFLVTFTDKKSTEELLIGDTAWTPEEGYIFFLINVTFENIGNKDLSYGKGNLPISPTTYFKATLIANGYEFDTRGSKFSIYEIRIREVIETYIFFEIPNDLQPSELKICHLDKQWILKL